MATKDAKATENTTGHAVTDEDEEWMDGAKASFAKAEHLAPSLPPNYGPGRLVAIWAKSQGTRKGDSGTYAYVETLTLVLDDSPNSQAWLAGEKGWDADASSLIGPAPVRLDGFQHSTTGLVSRLVPRLTGKHAKTGVPLRFRPMIGRINTQPSKVNKNVPAFSIAEPTAEDMIVARRYRDMIKEINQELEAADSDAENAEAFD